MIRRACYCFSGDEHKLGHVEVKEFAHTVDLAKCIKSKTRSDRKKLVARIFVWSVEMSRAGTSTMAPGQTKKALVCARE